MDWNQLEIFKGIDLNDSFVLNWTCEDGQLSFDLEASIWPESKYYAAPKANEYTCYRKAKITITGIESIDGLSSMDSVIATTDPDGSKDYGNIEILTKTVNGFELVGDFGKVEINGGELRFEVHT